MLKDYAINSIQNVNTGRIFQAQRDGRSYLLKEYQAFRFQDETGSRNRSNMNSQAEDFFQHLSKLAHTFGKNCCDEGLLNIPTEVFRDGARIYKASKLLQPCGLTTKDICRTLNTSEIDVLIKTVLLQLDKLQQIRFVHGDIKPENVVVQRRKDGEYVGSIIDYDDGFLIEDRGAADRVSFSPEYASPEMYCYQLHALKEDLDQEKLKVLFSRVDCASDLFSLACIYYQYLTGQQIGERSNENVYIAPGQLMISNKPVFLPELQINPVRHELIRRMIHITPGNRPTPRQAILALNEATEAGLIEELETPFSSVPARYTVTEQRVPFLDERISRIVRREDGCSMVMWHLNHDWFAIDRKGKGLENWKEHQEAALSRRACRKQIAARLSGIDDEAILPFTLEEEGRRVYAVSRIPTGKYVRLKNLHLFLTAEQIDDLMQKMLRSLHRLHENGVIHGNLTPENIWFVRDTEHPEQVQAYFSGMHSVYLADQIPLPEEMNINGMYDSPELYTYAGSSRENAEKILPYVTVASDIFSMGILYHVALTGEMPSTRNNAYSHLCCAVFNHQVTNAEIILSDRISPERARIIGQMMACEPADRPDGCAQTAELIAKLCC